MLQLRLVHGNFQKTYYNNPIGQNKNDSYSYKFNDTNYKIGLCGSGHNIAYSIHQGIIYYDAARANMGEPWMMFTKEQGQELIDNTTNELTSLNGINCRKFINKNDSSKYIIIPAGGYWKNTTHNSAGSDAHYWSTLSISSDYAWFLYFSYSNVIWPQNYVDRSSGKSIRPVRQQ